MEFTIRAYREGDAAHLIEVYERSIREIGPAKYSHEQVAAWAGGPRNARSWNDRILPREAYVAVSNDGQLVGWVEMELNGHLDFLYCLPKAARQGVADALYAVLVAGAYKLGVSHLTTEASRFAESFFRRHGWHLVRRESVTRDGVAIDRALMSFELR